ncbi:MAG: right-handed parallel beta-helix repeat-containing protein, partial [Opitutaceae bacterium]|nr:right-handed parallel beta-helix repeat-containing protein [Cytophagales bacterium]
GGIGLKLWDGTGPRPDSIKIKGLEIKNFGNAIYSSTTELTNVEIDSVLIHDNTSTAVLLYTQKNLKLTNSKIYSNQSNGVEIMRANNLILSGNEFYDNGNTEVTIIGIGKNVLVKNNKIGVSDNYTGKGKATQSLRILGNVDSILVRNNIIGNNQYGIFVDIDSTNSVVVEDNLIGVHNGSTTISTGFGILSSSGKMKLKNNIIANSDQYGVYAGHGVFELKRSLVYNSTLDNFKSNSTFKPTIDGYTTKKIVYGTTNPLDSVEIYVSDGRSPGANKAPLLKFLGITKADNQGNWNLQLSDTLGVNGKKYNLVALSTPIGKSTSDLSNQVLFETEKRICPVINTLDSGDGSLRSAIECANRGVFGSSITFQIPGTGEQTIQPLSPLPSLKSNIILDGFTQAGNGKYNIILDGSKDSTQGLGVGFSAKNTIVKGISFKNFKTGIFLYGTSDSNLISQNKFKNIKKQAIFVSGLCQFNSLENNVIDSVFSGIVLDGGSKNNKILGNSITNLASDGMRISGGSHNNSIAYNTIGKSIGYGVLVEAGITGNRIKKNFIGVDSLNNPLPIVKDGIKLENGSNATRITDNTIGNSGANAIYITSSLDTITGNFIGVTKSDINIANVKNGIYIDYQGGGKAVIGGDLAGEGNTLANNQNGIYVTQYSSGNNFIKNTFLKNKYKAILLEYIQGNSVNANNSKLLPIV